MQPEFAALLRKDFASFARKAFSTLNFGEKLGQEPYIDYLCRKLVRVAKGETTRVVFNIPPRHGKTFLGSICLSAWTLAHNPGAKIMVVTYAEQLAIDIAYKIRAILKSKWYRAVFNTRVAEDRSRVLDFATTSGGAVYAVSIEGGITGRGADLIIVDDPLDIKDAANPEQIERVNNRFDTLILSRLNRPKDGRIIVIAHRLDEHDLSGHLLVQGGWDHVVLPLIAVRRATYDVGHDRWRRVKDEVLRPDAFSRREVAHLRKTAVLPDFETLYQQNPGIGVSLRIRAAHFALQTMTVDRDLPVVLSIDPGQTGGPHNSFSVIQAWRPQPGGHLLVDQWREQTDYTELRSKFWLFVRRYRPAAVLIEATGQGPALVSDVSRKRWFRTIPVVPDGRSKAVRLREHCNTIRARRIQLPENAVWRQAFIAEFVEFPEGRYDDQVDATTQYLDWIGQNPRLDKAPARAIAAVGDPYGAAPVQSQVGDTSVTRMRGAVMVRYAR